MEHIDAMAYLIVGGVIDGEPIKCRVRNRGALIDCDLKFTATRTGAAYVAFANSAEGFFYESARFGVCSGTEIELKRKGLRR